DGELWEVHRELKADLIEYARNRLVRQRERHGEGPSAIDAATQALSPNALTLGFARRFATYKRATLLFRDPARLARILNDPARPVQVVFAGKAHPNDKPAQELIRQVYEYARQPQFAGKIVLLEDYDIDMARHLVSGCDVWLNNPIRPHEASGTSGQKASLNGLPNASIIDGWWEEGYTGANGWAFGERREYSDEKTRDDADANHLYEILEHEIIPLYFDRGLDGIPHNWVTVMKEAILTVAPQFSMRRMVVEYVEKLYLPALALGARMDADNYALARELAAWRRKVREHWGRVGLRVEGPREGQLQIGEPVDLTANVYLGNLKPEDGRVEVVAGHDDDGEITDRHVVEMSSAGRADDGAYRYRAQLQPTSNGTLVYGVRAVPSHPGLPSPLDTGLARWA
ncbi:MAG TPA: alpha-glucan family phosphorylase, partial [Ktedonobacterales bacterium]